MAGGVVPYWLHVVSMAALAAGIVCALVIAVDAVRHPQHMAVMNLVWPVTALFGTGMTLWAYFRYGRLATKARAMEAMHRGQPMPGRRQTPFPMMVAKATSHCGSGCALGDLCAEWLAFALPGLLVWLGWHSLFSDKVYAAWVLDYVFAFVIGIAFQYFTIVPMRHLGFRQGLWAAVKADALSLSAWQLGMYGFMALADFWLFRRVLGVKLEVDSAEFWFAMQIAMLCGFATSYPVNWWLLKAGWKEKM